MAIYLGEEEISGIVDLTEDVDTELTEQEEELAGLEEEVNALEDKPQSDIQYMIDETNSCAYLFYKYTGTDLNFTKNLDTSNVTDMYGMFNQCSNLTSLDVSSFDTSKVTNMREMFYNCKLLTNIDVSNFNTSNVTNMYSMFTGCENIISLDLSNFDMSNVTTTTTMFSSCKKLETIIGKLDLYNVDSLSDMFNTCKVLEEVTLLNIKKSLKLGYTTSYGTLLTNETLINTIQQLWDYSGDTTTYTLTLSTTSKTNIANIYVKLVTPTAEEIEADPYINNKKPCVVCESTDEGAMTLTEYATTQKNWAIA